MPNLSKSDLSVPDLETISKLESLYINSITCFPDREANLTLLSANLGYCIEKKQLFSRFRLGGELPIPYGIEYSPRRNTHPVWEGEMQLDFFPSSLPTLLALDLGTTTGWALRGGDGVITSGSQSFKPHRFEGGGMRFLRFKQWLTELREATGKVELRVYFEEVRRHASTDAAHAYGGFMAHLTAWCEHYQIPYAGVPVGTIKRFIAGKGNADKQAVINAVTARGHTPVDDNEADAIALLYWAIRYQGGLS